MSIVPFLPIITDIIDRIIPDKSANAKAKMELALLEQSGELQILLKNLDINEQEAQHRSLFVAGWRPFIGWTCAIVFVYHGIILHLITAIAALNGVDITVLPEFDIGMFSGILMGMLGLGSLRTYEKYKGLTK